jgi:hypothetical protein
MHGDSESNGDPRYHLPHGTPLITPERARKGDVFTGPDCRDCGTTGKDKITKLPCRPCKGRGWVGSTNAAGVDNADIRFAQVHEVNLLSKLWDSGHVTDQQHHDAQTFQIWRDMHRTQMGLEKPVSSGGEEVFGVRLRAYGYILILRKLSRHDNDAIETSLLPMLMSWAQWIARNRTEKYVAALERLSRVLPPVKDQIGYLEGLDEEQREEISKAGVKKLLEVIKDR